MQLILKTIGGDSSGKKLLLRQGQVASVGRTDWADFSVPGDPSLAEFHFEISCGANNCEINDRDGNGIQVDGKSVSSASLKNGQQIEAGSTLFEVEILGAVPEPDSCCGDDANYEDPHREELSPDVTPPAEMTTEPNPSSAAGYLVALDLGEEAKALLDQHKAESPFELLDQLIQKKCVTGTLGLTAGLLPKHAAIQWGVDCVRSVSRERSEKDEAAVAVVEKWLADPNERNRRAAESIAKENEFSGPADWLAMAAFWSEGSMSPEGQPSVLPPWYLTAKGVMAALTLTATKEPAKTSAHYESFIEKSQEFLAVTAK
ncbi:FHA domain-containing protein [Planctomycetota bacterium]